MPAIRYVIPTKVLRFFSPNPKDPDAGWYVELVGLYHSIFISHTQPDHVKVGARARLIIEVDFEEPPCTLNSPNAPSSSPPGSPALASGSEPNPTGSPVEQKV